MAQRVWKNAGSGNWSTASRWLDDATPGNGDDVLFNPGTFDAVINAGETFALRSLTQNGSFTRLAGVLSITEFSAVGVGGVVYGGSTTNGQGLITSTGTHGALMNQGQIAATVDGGVLQINTATLTNQGVLSASGGAILFVSSAVLTNMGGDVLTGGTYMVDGSTGTHGTAIEVLGGFLGQVGGVDTFGNGRVVTNNATIVLNGPNAKYLGWNQALGVAGGFQWLEDSLRTIGTAGALGILGGRNYVTANDLANLGVLNMGEGTLDAGTLVNGGVMVLSGGVMDPAAFLNVSGGSIFGYGTIVPALANGGLVQAQRGTLVLAGGIIDTNGALQVDPNGALAFQGLYSRSILNNGTIVVPAGMLRLTGAVSGVGGYFIDGGTPGAVTTLDLRTAISGDVAFNGAGGMLVLADPQHFTGSIIGFGAGDTIDLAGIVSTGATLAGGRLNITNAGTTVYSLSLRGNYSSASFSGASDGAGGTLITVANVAPRDFTIEGPRWATKTITWSLAQFNYAADTDPTPAAAEGTRNVPFSHAIDAGSQAAFVTVIRQALDAWATIGGFTFVQQADSNDPSLAADLRFGWGDLLGTAGEIGQASFNFAGVTFRSDVVIRLQDPAITSLVADAGVIGGFKYQGLASTFYQIVMHEVGHALGLGHSTDPAAVMFASAQGVQNQSPNASDIAGIHAIYDSLACFAAGTRILTARGEIAVERLVPGDRVATLLSGRLRPVRWVGRRCVVAGRHRRPAEVMPIRIAAGAFGPGRPLRDLLLSPDHAVFVGGDTRHGAPGDAKYGALGVLIPIRHLVNGATIRIAPMERVTYYHIELAEEDGSAVHDVLLAEGLPAESFLDTGNRDAFADAPAPALHPDFARRVWDAAGCAPLHEGGAVVDAAHARLLEIAASLGHVRTGDPGLHAVAGGRVIRPQPVGQAWRFHLPAGRIELRSRAEVPAEFSRASMEHRRLGVALRALSLNGVAIGLDDARLRHGFHPVEFDEGASWRWTDGAGVIVLDAPAQVDAMLGPAIGYWEGEVSAVPARQAG